MAALREMYRPMENGNDVDEWLSSVAAVTDGRNTSRPHIEPLVWTRVSLPSLHNPFYIGNGAGIATTAMALETIFSVRPLGKQQKVDSAATALTTLATGAGLPMQEDPMVLSDSYTTQATGSTPKLTNDSSDEEVEASKCNRGNQVSRRATFFLGEEEDDNIHQFGKSQRGMKPLYNSTDSIGDLFYHDDAISVVGVLDGKMGGPTNSMRRLELRQNLFEALRAAEASSNEEETENEVPKTLKRTTAHMTNLCDLAFEA